MTSSNSGTPSLSFMRDIAIGDHRSELTQPGAPDDAKSDLDWLARANGRLVVARGKIRHANVPKTLHQALAPDGKLHKSAEIYAFGKWLLLDGAPSLPATRGVQPDRRKVVETLCCAIHVAEGLGHTINVNGSLAAKAPKAPTKTNLVEPMRRLFEQDLATSDFDTRIKTLRRILDAYLRHIAAGGLCIAGKPVTASPRLKALQQRFKSRGKGAKSASPTASAPGVSGVSAASLPSSTAPVIAPVAVSVPIPAVLSVKSAKSIPPVMIPLFYAHQNRREEYRTKPFAGLSQSNLHYIWIDPKPHANSKGLRPDRRDIIVLKPALDVVAQSALKAVIDRLAITLQVDRTTNGVYLHKLLGEAGLIGIAHDRRLNPKGDRNDFKYHLDDLDPGIGPGTHFAILIQEPCPEKIKAFLCTVHASCTIVSDVVPFLLEFAIDFFPNATKSPDEMVTLREQLVGVIQRHFWCKPGLFKDETGAFNVQHDPRQVYSEAVAKLAKARFLIPTDDISARQSIFSWKKAPSIRSRIIENPASGFLLNATQYLGSRETGVRFSAQHKISDQKDKRSGTSRSLMNEERRARLELELQGAHNLRPLGIHTISDVASIQFREVFLRHGSFKLPVMKKQGVALQDFITVFGFRGVIGASLFSAVQEFESRKKLKAEGKYVARASEAQAPGLEPWVEVNLQVGHALDKLSKQWSKFAWP